MRVGVGHRINDDLGKLPRCRASVEERVLQRVQDLVGHSSSEGSRVYLRSHKEDGSGMVGVCGATTHADPWWDHPGGPSGIR